jgi:cytochrome c-type biogenesis protein CcmH/NrfG
VRTQSWIFLAAGFAIGFAVLYYWTGERAPQVVRAFPQMAPPGGPPGAGEPAPPPLDLARVGQLEERLRSNPRDFDALVEMGNIQFDQMNYPEATRLYSEALQVQPDNINVRTDMATTMFYSQNFDGAIEEFGKVLSVEPSHPQALFNIGVAYLHGKNDPGAALQHWERLLAANPNHPQAEMVRQQITALKARIAQPAAQP